MAKSRRKAGGGHPCFPLGKGTKASTAAATAAAAASASVPGLSAAGTAAWGGAGAGHPPLEESALVFPDYELLWRWAEEGLPDLDAPAAAATATATAVNAGPVRRDPLFTQRLTVPRRNREYDAGQVRSDVCLCVMAVDVPSAGLPEPF
jgi:hypothetical protein